MSRRPKQIPLELPVSQVLVDMVARGQCPPGECVDTGDWPTCKVCGYVLERVHRAIMMRMKCSAVRRGRGRCMLRPGHEGDHNDGAGGRWSDIRAPRRRARKKGKSRWSLLEIDCPHGLTPSGCGICAAAAAK